MKAKSDKRASKKHGSKNRASHPSVDAAAAGAHDAVDWAAEAANNATDNVNGTGREMKAAQEKWLAQAHDYVQDNPATSVGIALAGGYLLGRIFSAR